LFLFGFLFFAVVVLFKKILFSVGQLSNYVEIAAKLFFPGDTHEQKLLFVRNVFSSIFIFSAFC